RGAGGVERGTMVVIDYGDEEPDLWRRHPAGTLLTYREESLGVDLLANPGEADITAHVNFSALSRAALAAGLERGALRTQREWLESLGSAQVADDLRRRQEEPQFAGDHTGM